ncbi:MAG: hypothetical protein JWO03_3814 [Bacteroidetes bacterium]|nr:hypothetical protein [Bacteroidota bacterium]
MKKISFLLLSAFCLFANRGFAQTFSSIDIFTGAGDAVPMSMTEYNGKVYFAATGSNAQGTELWVTDGTQAGTHLVSDILPGPGSSNPYGFIVANNFLFFIADDSIHGSELWTTDGTTTTMVVDINPGTTSGAISNTTVMNNKLYFSANDGSAGQELWVSDGTPGGTSLLKDIQPGPISSNPVGYQTDLENGLLITGFNLYNNRLYFRADDGVHGTELWSTDGTSAGTAIFADMLPGPGSGAAYCVTPLNGNLIMGATDSVHGYELWISDGTPAGTSMLKDINTGSGSSSAGANTGFVAMGGKLYFAAYSPGTGAGYELWQTDGTTAGTTIVKDILPGPGSSYAGYYGFGILNGKLYFSANDSVNGHQLWSSDGTPSGTTLVKILSDITPDNALPIKFITYNGQLIFTATPNTASGRQLWTTDGTSAGTHMISPAVAPNASPMANAAGLVPYCLYNGNLLVEANFNSIGDELWIYHTAGVGITEMSGGIGISVYPNPFNTSVTLSGLDSREKYTMQLLDVTGRQYYSTAVPQPSENTQVMMPELSTGIYIMRVSGQNSSSTFRLVRK